MLTIRLLPVLYAHCSLREDQKAAGPDSSRNSAVRLIFRRSGTLGPAPVGPKGGQSWRKQTNRAVQTRGPEDMLEAPADRPPSRPLMWTGTCRGSIIPPTSR